MHTSPDVTPSSAPGHWPWWRKPAALMACLLGLCMVLPAQAARQALVIGNAAYVDGPLKNPVNDARAMDQKLTALGFKVQRIENLKRQQIGQTLRGFASTLKPGDEVVVFYAGHGVQVKGVNYLPVVDADIQSEDDVPLNSLNLNALMDRLDEAKVGLKLIFLDACRNNPYARSFRSGDRGLARVGSAPSGTLIHFATRPGSVAADGSGSNGLYTSVLIRYLDAPDLPVEAVLKKVSATVEAESRGAQEPWTEGSIRGDFFFNGGQGSRLNTGKLDPGRVTPLPGLPPGTSLDDLEKEEASRKQWAQWQARMKADFDKTAAFAGSADLQVKAWDRFLTAWAQDNPLTRDDDELRAQATARRDRARQLSDAPAPMPSTGGQTSVDGAQAAPDLRYPNRPVTIVVPFAAGGPTDQAARQLAQALQAAMPNTTWVIDNAAGAGGNLGALKVARAAADGYTLLFSTNGISTLPTMLRNGAIKPLDELEFLGLVSEFPMVLVGRSTLPASGWPDLQRWLQSNNGRINLATAGTGSPSHLCGMLLGAAARVDLTTIPYRGTGPALSDLSAAQTDLMCDASSNVESLLSAGRIKGFAVMSGNKPAIGAARDLPLVGGLPGGRADMTVWQGLYAPRGTPAGVLSRLNQALQQAQQNSEFRRRQEALGAVMVTDARNQPGGHRRFVEAETARMGALIRAAGAYMD